MSLDNILQYLNENPSLLFLSWILISFTGSLIIYLISIRLVRRGIRSLYPELYGQITHRVRKPVFFLFIIIGLLIPFIFEREEAQWQLIVQKILITFLIFTVAWLLIKILHVIRLFVTEQFDIGVSDNLRARKIYTQYKILERIMIFIILFIALGIALMTYEPIKQIGMSLLTSAGVSALIIGLAAQKVLGALLAGIQLAITQPIRIDDVVIVEGEWGRIEEIHLTYVVVRIWDKRRLVLPTTYFIEKPFQNWTMTSADILGTVYIYADYRVPIDEIRKALSGFLKETDKWDGEVDVLQVTNTTEKTVELRALMSARDASEAWELRVFIREKLIGFIQEKYPEYLPRTRVEIEKGESGKQEK